MSRRIEYIDICKALAIFAMVFCHVGLRLEHSDSELSRYIHLWHMPIFFILSGLVLNSNKWLGWSKFKQFVVSRSKSILLPYLFWGGICNIYLFIVTNYVKTDLKIMSLHDLWATSFDFTLDTISGFGWFLPAMFLTELLFVVISNCLGTQKKMFLLYIIFAMLGMRYGDMFIMQVPLAIDVLPFTLGFFALGYLFRNQIMSFQYKNISVSILILLFILCWYFLPFGANIRVSKYHPIYICWFLCMILSLSIIEIIKHYEYIIVNNKLFKHISFLGKNTLLIYLLHLEIIRILPIKSMQIESVIISTVIQFLLTLCILYLLSFIIKFINRYMKWSLGRF